MSYLFVKRNFGYSLESLFSVNDRTIYFYRGYNGVSFKDICFSILVSINAYSAVLTKL